MKLGRRIFESFIYISMIIVLVMNMPTCISTWDNHLKSEDIKVNQSLGNKVEQENNNFNKKNESAKGSTARYDKEKNGQF
ncbi:hypothetical protein SDC9_76590 [bioreactor metagenome]|uniref:Uncharacterized protein n=1 Tax=bioreactor metagenome TaxID=1076179 RepID=A0A644YPX7_9ZZZZ